MSEEELEDLKWQQTEYEEDIIIELVKENEKLHSIIKEVREYIEENYPTSTINYQDDKYKLLEILDKENQ